MYKLYIIYIYIIYIYLIVIIYPFIKVYVQLSKIHVNKYIALQLNYN